MLIKHATNGGVAEVDDELGTKLIASPTGEWVAVDAPAKKAPAKKAPTKKAQPTTKE